MNNNKSADFIVLGLGSMGSATCATLAKQGHRVFGFDQFSDGHTFGSSHGETRMIRKAYFEHPHYIPLLERAYTLWEELEKVSGVSLLQKTGLVLFGDPQKSILYRESLKSARQYNIPVEEVSTQDAQIRWPMYQPKKIQWGLYEPSGGIIFCDQAIQAQLGVARKYKAKIHLEEKILSYKILKDCVQVETNHGEYYAEKLIVTAGAWSAKILADLKIPLRIKRKFHTWFPATQMHSIQNKVPCFGFHFENSFFYGFPSLDKKTIKIAEHFNGDFLESPEDESSHFVPSIVLTGLQQFIQKCLPFVSPEVVKTMRCLYTLTPDEHFIIDIHPVSQRLIVAAGFSGHGFKFSPVIGEILSELALIGSTRHSIDFLKLRSFNESSK